MFILCVLLFTSESTCMKERQTPLSSHTQPCIKLTRKQQAELCGYMFHSPCLYTATKTGKWIPPLVDVAFIPNHLQAGMSPIILFTTTTQTPTPHLFFFFFFTAALSSTVFRQEFQVGLHSHVIINTWFDVFCYHWCRVSVCLYICTDKDYFWRKFA